MHRIIVVRKATNPKSLLSSSSLFAFLFDAGSTYKSQFHCSFGVVAGRFRRLFLVHAGQFSAEAPSAVGEVFAAGQKAAAAADYVGEAVAAASGAGGAAAVAASAAASALAVGGAERLSQVGG